MKKLATLASLFLIAAAGTAQAQTLSIHSSDSVLVTTPSPRDLPFLHADVTNTSTETVKILVFRTVENLPTGQDTYFCWSLGCYAPFTNESADTVVLAAGATETTFKAYLNPNGVEGNSSVRYEFRDLTHNQSVYLRIRFIATPTAVAESEARAQLITGALPATGSLRLAAAPGVRVQLQSMDGRTVRQATLASVPTELPLAGLTAGTYILTTADGRKVRVPVQ